MLLLSIFDKVLTITALQPEVEALKQNAKKLKEARDVVRGLAASRRRKGAESRNAASCTKVDTLAVTLTNLVINSPAIPPSPQVLVYCATIIASRNLVCTDAEKTSLEDLDSKFEGAVNKLDSSIEDAQRDLDIEIGVIHEKVNISTHSCWSNKKYETFICVNLPPPPIMI